MFILNIHFITGAFVRVSSDNLVELQAIQRGLEIAHRETPCLDMISVSGDKIYPYTRETDNG